MRSLALIKHPAAVGLIVLHVTIFLAGFLGPYDPAQQNRSSALLPPTALHFIDARGSFHLRPFVRSAEEDRLFPVRFLVTGSAYRLFGIWPMQLHLIGVQAPGRIFLLGTDEFGRDQLSRILWGGQVSLLTGWLAALLSLSIGLILGSSAGFFGGWQDALVMRGAELFLALPWLYLLLAIRAFLPLSLSPGATAMVLAGLIGTVGWARPARLIRGMVLSAKERDFVYAARGFGASPWYLLRRHCLPETYGVLATQGALLVPQYMLAEVTLSFVGLGVAEPSASWGTLLAPLRQVALLASSWWMIAPAVPVVLASWCFWGLEDALADN